MAKNTLADLRDHLFETLEALKDKEKPMDIDRAQAVAQVSAQIINAAKTELQFLSMVGQDKLPTTVEPERAGKFFETKGHSTGKHLGNGKQ